MALVLVHMYANVGGGGTCVGTACRDRRCLSASPALQVYSSSLLYIELGYQGPYNMHVGHCGFDNSSLGASGLLKIHGGLSRILRRFGACHCVSLRVTACHLVPSVLY